jgi:hypothetical protein
MPVRKHLYQQVTRLRSYTREPVVPSETNHEVLRVAQDDKVIAVEG